MRKRIKYRFWRKYNPGGRKFEGTETGRHSFLDQKKPFWSQHQEQSGREKVRSR